MPRAIAERRDDRLDRAGRGERVTDLPLLARDRDAREVVAEDARRAPATSIGSLSGVAVPCAFT